MRASTATRWRSTAPAASSIVRRQPAAVDLRLIMAISKIVTDLERIGDEAKKIARMAKKIHEGGAHHAQRFPAIRHAAQIAVKMLRQALDAFARLDVRQRRRGPEGGLRDRRPSSARCCAS